MSASEKSPFIITGPVISYVSSTLLWLSISIGSGLLTVWQFVDSSYEVPNPFTSYPTAIPVTTSVQEKSLTALELCKQNINNILQQQTIHFQTGSARLATRSTEIIQQIAEQLTPCQHATIAIKGHTDNVGTLQQNMTLSLRRAESVAIALKKRGFSASKFVISGAGELQPVADNKTQEGRYKNRRIEIRLYE